MSNKQFSQYRNAQTNCDHSKHTETLGNTNCCFCAKLMAVLCERNDITGSEFVEQYGQWLRIQPDFIEAMNKVKATL
jgi:hypothetical protein